MILGKEDCELFFSLYDALTDYANGKWGVAPAVIDQNTGFVNEDNQRVVAAEVWRNPAICEELAAESGFGIPESESAILRSWKHAYTDTFYAVRDGSGRIFFLTDDTAFEVCGLSREIISMLNTMPTVLTATLLPFRGKVVHAVYLEERPAIFGMGMKDLIEKLWEQVRASGTVIGTAEAFLKAAPSLEERRISREAERMLDSLEADMQPDEPGPDMHRGALAGLDESRREQVVRENAYVYADAREAQDELAPYCMRGEPVCSLEGIMMDLTRDELLEYARSIGLKRCSSASKARLASRIADAVLQPETVQELLRSLDFDDYENVKKIYRQGSHTVIPAADMKSSDDFYPEAGLFILPFLYKGDFHFVIPDELSEALGHVDWAAADAVQKENRLLVTVANFMVEMRGVCRFDEAWEAYRAVSQRPFDMAVAAEVLGRVPHEDNALCTLWFETDPDRIYLVHADLTRSYGDREDDPYLQRIRRGRLPVEIEDLVFVQKGKHPRPLSEEMLSVGEYVEWARRRPAAVAFRDWLDAHVPDGSDDYTFADALIGDLVVMCTEEFPVKSIFEHLFEAVALPDVRQAERAMELFSNFASSLPRWSNNGWTPNEIREGSAQVFYNEDGSAKRVGPFDRCPCGSGRLYKDCHGSGRFR